MKVSPQSVPGSLPTMRFRWMVLLSLWISLSGPVFAPPASGMIASPRVPPEARPEPHLGATPTRDGPTPVAPAGRVRLAR